MNVVPVRQDSGSVIESVITKGDLGKLTPQERTTYYVEVCKSVGLNPLTKPFEYITLNNKLTLYALRNCTDQLRTIHGVSVVEMTENEREGVFIVTAKVANKDGRTDMAKGAVTIANLKGDALANAFMKAETKAKRRATLSICGLGFLDETEIETIPDANRATTLPKKDAREIYTKLQNEINEAKSHADLKAWGEANAERIQVLPPDWQDFLRLKFSERLVELRGAKAGSPISAESAPAPAAVDPETGEVWDDFLPEPTAAAAAPAPEPVDDLTIPPALDRRKPGPFNQTLWLQMLGTACDAAKTTDELIAVQAKHMTPLRAKVNSENWERAVELFRARMNKLIADPADFNGDQWLNTDFAGALSGAEDLKSLAVVKDKILVTAKDKLNDKQWKLAVAAYHARRNELDTDITAAG